MRIVRDVATPAPPAEPARPARDSSASTSSGPLVDRLVVRLAPLVIWLFRRWYRRRARTDLGPTLGFISGELREEEIAAALPEEAPPHELLASSAGQGWAQDSGPTEGLRRANMWSAVLEAEVRRQRKPTAADVATTYGFFSADRHVQFGVIRYMRPIAAFRTPPPRSIEVAGHSFPVVLRPWLGDPSHGTLRSEEPCWVKFDNGGRLGFITANHVIRPKTARLGATVKTATRIAHPTGTLARRSVIMDAAVVEVDPDDWRGKPPDGCSTVVGYKPLRFYVRGRTIDVQVIEHSGFTDAVVPLPEDSGEPLQAVLLFLNASLEHGDSGAIGYDREFARYEPGPPELPYLLYRGAQQQRKGLAGYGLFLHQAERAWSLTFHGGV